MKRIVTLNVAILGIFILPLVIAAADPVPPPVKVAPGANNMSLDQFKANQAAACAPAVVYLPASGCSGAAAGCSGVAAGCSGASACSSQGLFSRMHARRAARRASACGG